MPPDAITGRERGPLVSVPGVVRAFYRTSLLALRELMRRSSGSTQFRIAFSTSMSWSGHVMHLTDIEYRYVTRFRLWTVPADDPRLVAQVARLIERREGAIERAEASIDWVGMAWHAASTAMPPIGAYCGQVSALSSTLRRDTPPACAPRWLPQVLDEAGVEW